jgi:stress-induced-phosphoprotein 1
MAAEQAKDRGNKLFSAGNYTDAIASFSEAIALYEKAGGNVAEGKLHVYYSNRSAAYLKKGDGKNALLDAEKCISLQKDWAKGYSRKGAALHYLQKYTDAYRTYTEGLKIEPSNVALKEGLNAVQIKMMSTSGSTNSPSSSQVPMHSVPVGTTTTTLKQFLLGDKKAIFDFFQFSMRFFMVINFIFYWIPFMTSSSLAYGWFFKIATFNHASFLFFTHGVPKFQATYAQRLVMDPTTQSFFYCLLFWFSVPYPLAMFPILLVEIVHWSAYLSTLVSFSSFSGCGDGVQKAIDPVMSKILGLPNWSMLSTPSKWSTVYQRIPQVCANMEVFIGVCLILELLTPSRNFMLLIIYWQLLRVRYMINTQIQHAFRQLNAGIVQVTHHPKCPAFIGQGYRKIQSFAHKLTDIEQQQAQAASMPKCTIM